MGQIIDQLPKTVEEVYEKLLNRNTQEPENRREAQVLLHLVVSAKRPLTLKEVDIAFNMALQYPEPPVEELDLDDVYLATRIRNLCGLFLFIHNSKIYLIHQTAKEFLVTQYSSSKTGNHNWKLSLNAQASEELWASVCISYLLSLHFEVSDSEGRYKLMEQTVTTDGISHNLLEYAAKYWPDRFHAVALDERYALLQHACRLYNDKTVTFKRWGSINLDGWFQDGLIGVP